MSFKRLDPQDFLISADSVVGPIWSTDAATLTTFFTKSSQDASDYYWDVYQADPTTDGSEVQFAVSWGNKLGSGSVQFNSNIKGKSGNLF